MKKSLAIIAALMMGGVAMAGQVIWSCDGVAINGSPVNGGVAYLFVGDDTSSVAESIQKGTINYGSAIATATTDEDGYFKVTKIGSYQSEDVSLYMVVFDSAEPSSTAKFVVSNPMTKSFGQTGNQTYAFANDSAIKNPTWIPVTIPEPTTVALLALGLAALGLKRKVA